MLNMRKQLDEINYSDSYKRVDGIHPLDLYVGMDELSRWTLLLISSIQPPVIASSKMIDVKQGLRTDGKWALTLSLINDTYSDMFIMFCEDIVESSRYVQNKEQAVRFIAKRYMEWREMLANSRSMLLSPEEVKGLLGEMYYLKEYLYPQYGTEKAALSWTGPRNLPQDFVIDETWYEVKTISSNKSEVIISSIEQLDSTKIGELVVINADKTSITNSHATNLNVLYKEVLYALENDDTKSTFCNMLLRYGYYPRHEYESAEYTYEIKELRRYAVTDEFPCLRRKDIPDSVLMAKYSLALTAIRDFRKG